MMASTRFNRSGAPRLAALAALLSLAMPCFALAADPWPAATPVEVERVKPAKEKHVTLRFLKENRDFIRGQFDRLRERPLEVDGAGGELDPRYLAYARLVAQATTARDTVERADEERARRHLLESIAQLASLENQLDLMEKVLAEQRLRLSTLEDDFVGHQRTALMVVLSGYPTDATVQEVTVAIDDGSPVTVTLSPEQRESLKRGGIVELFHGLVEPREQAVEVTLRGETWPDGNSGYLRLDPLRDRLTFLRLDLSQVHPAQGGAGVQAGTWLHEPGHRNIDG